MYVIIFKDAYDESQIFIKLNNWNEEIKSILTDIVNWENDEYILSYVIQYTDVIEGNILTLSEFLKEFFITIPTILKISCDYIENYCKNS